MKHLFALALLLLLPLVAWSQAPRWVSLSTAGLDRSNDLSTFVHPNGTWFAWNSKTRYRSTDRGLSWQRLPDTTGVGIMQVDRDGLLYVTSGQALWRSSDNGDTWSVASDYSVIGNDLSFTGADSAWMIRYQWPNVSTDRGMHWAKAHLPGSELALYSSMATGRNGRVAVANSQALWVSTDNGASWEGRRPAASVGDIAFDPDGNLYATASGSLFRSSDDGVSWRRIDSVHLMSMAPGRSGELYANVSSANDRTELDGVIRSTDGGLSWTTLYRDFVRSMSIGTDNEIVISTGAAIRVSTDGGLTWQTRSAGISDPDVGLLAQARAGELYVMAHTGTMQVPVYPPSGNALFRSTNAGRSWTFMKDSLSQILYIQPDGTIYGVVVSTEHVPGSNVALGTPVVSTDRGATWRSGPTIRGRINGIVGDGRGTVVVASNIEDGPRVGSTGLLRTTDGGASWTPTGHSPTFSLLRRSDNGTIFAYQVETQGGTKPRLQRSTDGGATWTVVLGDTSLSHLAIAPDGTIYAAGSAGGAQLLLRSDDNGATWLSTANFARPRAMTVDAAGRLYVGIPERFPGKAGLIRSSDGGATWSTLKDTVDLIAILPAAGGIIYLRSDKGIFRSTDDGATWESFTSGLPANDAFLAIGVDGHVYATVSGVGVFRTTEATGEVGRERTSAAAGVTVRPNPFRGVTTITLRLDARADIRIDILDPLGRVVARPYRGMLDAGEHAIAVDADALDAPGSGVFFCRVERDGMTTTVPMVVLR